VALARCHKSAIGSVIGKVSVLVPFSVCLAKRHREMAFAFSFGKEPFAI
jgi:hypothetical protein